MWRIVLIPFNSKYDRLFVKIVNVDLHNLSPEVITLVLPRLESFDKKLHFTTMIQFLWFTVDYIWIDVRTGGEESSIFLDTWQRLTNQITALTNQIVRQQSRVKTNLRVLPTSTDIYSSFERHIHNVHHTYSYRTISKSNLFPSLRNQLNLIPPDFF